MKQWSFVCLFINVFQDEVLNVWIKYFRVSVDAGGFCTVWLWSSSCVALPNADEILDGRVQRSGADANEGWTWLEEWSWSSLVLERDGATQEVGSKSYNGNDLWTNVTGGNWARLKARRVKNRQRSLQNSEAQPALLDTMHHKVGPGALTRWISELLYVQL